MRVVRSSMLGVSCALAAAALAACESSSASSSPDTSSSVPGAQEPGAPHVADEGAKTPPPESTARPEAPPPPPVDPDTFAPGEADVVTPIDTLAERRPISPLIYGMNTALHGTIPAAVLAGTTFLRRGGDRCNAYNWETNVSNGSFKTSFSSDMFLAEGLANPNAPGELDRATIAEDLAAGRGTMVPFVLNGYVSGPLANDIGYATPGWNVDAFFRRVELVKPTPFGPTPDVADGVVYTDEHLDFLRRQFPGDIYAPGPTQVMVGTDNEPDLFAFNFPMLQRGSGAALVAENGVTVGHRLTASEFTQRFLVFAKRVKQLAPGAAIVGPDHYHYDGWTTFHDSTNTQYSDGGRWYMDDFLDDVRKASDASGQRLLDTWDFHWYPQRVFGGTFTWELDDAKRKMTEEEIEAVLQGPRSYWDHTWNEHSWITDDHLGGPAYILERLFARLATGYPGTKLGVTEYFPGGCGHVSSGLGVVDTLGVFGRMGVHVAAMWPHTCDLTFAFGGFELVRNADGAGLRFDATSVEVDHPEVAESSVYAASDGPERVTVLVVNKTNAPRRFGLRVHHPKLADVEVRLLDAAHAKPTLLLREPLVKTNAYLYEAPARSAALLVFRAK